MPIRKKAADVLAEKKVLAEDYLNRLKYDTELAPEGDPAKALYKEATERAKTPMGVEVLAAWQAQTNSYGYRVTGAMSLLIKRKRNGLKSDDINFLIKLGQRRNVMGSLAPLLLAHKNSDINTIGALLDSGNANSRTLAIADPRCTPDFIEAAIANASQTTNCSELLESEKLSGPAIVRLMRKPLQKGYKASLLEHPNVPQEVSNKAYMAAARGKGLRGVFTSEESRGIIGRCKPDTDTVLSLLDATDAAKVSGVIELTQFDKVNADTITTKLWNDTFKGDLDPFAKAIRFSDELGDSISKNHGLQNKILSKFYSRPADAPDFSETASSYAMGVLSDRVHAEGAPMVPPEVYDAIVNKLSRTEEQGQNLGTVDSDEMRALKHKDASKEQIVKTLDAYAKGGDFWGKDKLGGALLSHPSLPPELIAPMIDAPGGHKFLSGMGQIDPTSALYPIVERMLTSDDAERRTAAMDRLAEAPKSDLLKHLDNKYSDVKNWATGKLVEVDSPIRALQLTALLRERPELLPKLAGTDLISQMRKKAWRDDPDRFRELAQDIAYARENKSRVPPLEYPISDTEKKTRNEIRTKVYESIIANKNHEALSSILQDDDEKDPKILSAAYAAYAPLGGTKPNGFKDASLSEPDLVTHTETMRAFIGEHHKLLSPEQVKWLGDNAQESVYGRLIERAPHLVSPEELESHFFGPEGEFKKARNSWALNQTLNRIFATPEFKGHERFLRVSRADLGEDFSRPDDFLRGMKSSVIENGKFTKEQLQGFLADDSLKLGSIKDEIKWKIDSMVDAEKRAAEKKAKGAEPESEDGIDSTFSEKAAFLVDSSKLRKLRDAILAANPATHNMHSKEVAKIMGGDYSKFRDKHGLVNADVIQEHLDKAPPTVEYNIDHSTWGHNGWDRDVNSPKGWNGYLGQQKHNNEQSKVTRINLTDKLIAQMKTEGVYNDFKRVMNHVRQHHGCHPMDFNNTIGWVRWTGDPEKNNEIFIDEVQTDAFSDMHNMMAEGELADETRKKINNIIYGGKHANLAALEAFHQYWRGKGKVGLKIAMHDVSSKQTISLGAHTTVRWPDAITLDAAGKVTGVKPGKQLSPPPVHMVTTYSEIPPKNMGMEPAEYRKQNMVTQNNPWFQGRKTWQHSLRKDIAEVAAPAYLTKERLIAGFKKCLEPDHYNSIASPDLTRALDAIGGVDANPNFVALLQRLRDSGSYGIPLDTIPFDLKQADVFLAIASHQNAGYYIKPASLFNNAGLNASPAIFGEFTKKYINAAGKSAGNSSANMAQAAAQIHSVGKMTPEVGEWFATTHTGAFVYAVSRGYDVPKTPELIERIASDPSLSFKSKLELCKLPEAPAALRGSILSTAMRLAKDGAGTVDDRNTAASVMHNAYMYSPTDEQIKAIASDPELERQFGQNQRNWALPGITTEIADAVALNRKDSDDYPIAGLDFAKKISPAVREQILTDSNDRHWPQLATTLAMVVGEEPITDSTYRIAHHSKNPQVLSTLWAMKGWKPEELIDAADMAISTGDTDLATTLANHDSATAELVDKLTGDSDIKSHLLRYSTSPFMAKHFKEALRSPDRYTRDTASRKLSIFSDADLDEELKENPHADVLAAAVARIKEKKPLDPDVFDRLVAMGDKDLDYRLSHKITKDLLPESGLSAHKGILSRQASVMAERQLQREDDEGESHDFYDIARKMANADPAAFEPIFNKLFSLSVPPRQRQDAADELAQYLPAHIISQLATHTDAKYPFHAMPNAPVDVIEKIALDPLADTYHRIAAMEHNGFTRHEQLLKDPSAEIRQAAIRTGGLHPDVLQAHLANETSPNLKHQIELSIKQQTPDKEYKRRVKVTMNTMKIRKLRDILETKPTKDIHVKEIAKIPGLGGQWDKFKDGKGRVSSARLQQHLDTAQPDLDFNVSYARFNMRMASNDQWDVPGTLDADGKPDWDGIITTQRHNNRPSNVLQINITDDIVNRVRQAGLYPVFDRVLRQRHSVWHPLRRGDETANGWDWNHTLGWVRWTGSPDSGIFIDELQSDFGQDLNKLVKAGKLNKDHAKKLQDVVYGGHHPNVVMGETFLQWLRDKGHSESKVAIHGLDSKARISLPDKPSEIHPPPVHMKITYNDTPPGTWGMEPSEYKESNMPTQNNPHFQGRKTWQGLVRKYENAEPMTREELSQLEAILSVCEI